MILKTKNGGILSLPVMKKMMKPAVVAQSQHSKNISYEIIYISYDSKIGAALRLTSLL